jgi:hypothetical protein
MHLHNFALPGRQDGGSLVILSWSEITGIWEMATKARAGSESGWSNCSSEPGGTGIGVFAPLSLRSIVAAIKFNIEMRDLFQ